MLNVLIRPGVYTVLIDQGVLHIHPGAHLPSALFRYAHFALDVWRNARQKKSHRRVKPADAWGSKASNEIDLSEVCFCFLLVHLAGGAHEFDIPLGKLLNVSTLLCCQAFL